MAAAEAVGVAALLGAAEDAGAHPEEERRVVVRLAAAKVAHRAVVRRVLRVADAAQAVA